MTSERPRSLFSRIVGMAITGPAVAIGVYLSFPNTHELVLVGLGSVGSLIGFVFGPRAAELIIHI